MRKFFLLFFNLYLFAHPLNLTKMDFNLTDHILHLRFVSYNIEKALSLQFDNENEIRNASIKISEYTKKHLKIDGCILKLKRFKVNNEIVIDEYYNVLCNNSGKLGVFFDMFFKEDDTQIGVLKIINKNKEYILNFNNKNTYDELEYEKKTSLFDFLYLGVIHILEGFDHITFLLTLLFPAILFNTGIKSTLKDILVIITAFSVSHSISLVLSAFNIVEFNPELIEILITVTILFTAFNNLFHFIDYKKEWFLAFMFGFIHGFAFSEAIRDMNMELKSFIKVVIGFNLGVEIGQILIVLFATPFLYFLIKKEKNIYYLLNVTAMIMALLWMMDRMFNSKFMPF